MTDDLMKSSGSGDADNSTHADEQRLYPKVRFRGFDEPWKKVKARQLFISKSKKNYPALPVLSASQELGMIYRSNLDSDIKTERSGLKNYKLIEPGDFVIHLRSFQGGFAYSDKRGIASPAYTVFTFKDKTNHDDYFWKEKFQTYNFIQLLKQVTYGIRDGKSISYSDFSTLKLTYTSKKEQVQISKCLKQINSLLSLQQRKLELEKQLELYVTDDLLVYETESKIIPKVRFNSFCQSWKKVKLKEIIGKIQSGNRLPKTNLEEGSIPYILAQSKNNGIYMYISKDTLDFNGNALKLFPADSITFSIDNPQAIYYQPEPFYTSNIMRVIHSQHLNKFDYMFIIMNLKKYTKEFDWSRKFSGPVVSNLQVSIPGNIDERRKIGKLICKIQLHRLLDEKAKREIIKLKRFLLQNLFI
ncbi:restriction endonuclease subunit S [Lactobacillus mulieris]|uniref:restriction endonuclease subunit S n=1 Tax=Lactobacillus mulieris TaxID=2508708 RepID=UPI0022AC8C2C|nr:restriction endonuclease subunit S [Lactobacillus mulieris]MCZ3740820.1 restriction endonuclease subunit S [Lactobacillus mulieris]MCZ3747658.1 restriction endonuclease subunit S [Lactobacillus mulieris]MCZ3749550.1 restriction endonuclease subunit S [Lactobacillus mulieris]